MRLKLQKPNSKLWPDLVLLIQTLQLCFCWTDLLPFLPSHLLLITCATEFAHYGKISYLQFLRGDLAAVERELPEMAWSCDRISLVPALPTALHPGCRGIARSHSFMADPSLAVDIFTPGLERLHQPKVLSSIAGIKSHKISQVLQCEYSFMFGEVTTSYV